MDTGVTNQLKDIISKNNSVGIALGKNPDVDAMAAALSLSLVLAAEGKSVSVVCPTEALVEHSRLVGIDKVKSSFESNSGDMTVSFPYEEGEIEKISYTLENGQLNIIVKAGEMGLSFDEKDVEFKRSQGYPSLLFVIGTSRLSDLDRIYDPQALKDTTVVNIDNKADNQGFGDISIVSPNSSSISEKVADLMLSLDLNIDIDTAQNLLIGIETATQNFQNPRTTSIAFEITGELIRKGAVRGSNGLAQMANDFVDQEDPNAPAFTPASNPFPRQMNRPQRPMPRINRPQRQVLGFNQQVDLQNMPRQNVRDDSEENKDMTAESKDPSRPFDNAQGKDSGQAKGKKPPVDWLTPKIYKGSTNI